MFYDLYFRPETFLGCITTLPIIISRARIPKSHISFFFCYCVYVKKIAMPKLSHNERKHCIENSEDFDAENVNVDKFISFTVFPVNIIFYGFMQR